MSKARLIITAVVVEGRSKSEVARDYDVSRYWVHQLLTRYHAEGEAAYEPRSRRPHTSPHAVPAAVEDEIIRLRKELSRCGPEPRGRPENRWNLAVRLLAYLLFALIWSRTRSIEARRTQVRRRDGHETVPSLTRRPRQREWFVPRMLRASAMPRRVQFV